jgi:hypothetical protein
MAMADEYIRRKDAAKLLGYIFGVDVVRRLHEVPAADVAEVVRCKDCQYWKRNVGLTDSPNGHCFEHDIDTNGRDFCSYGERMRQAKRGKVRRKYGEILTLYQYCVEAGMDVRLERLHDGWAIRFPNGGDFAQHAGTYGTNDGFVEPAIGCEKDYSPVSLREAEKLICENRERLVTPSCEGERGMEGE